MSYDLLVKNGQIVTPDKTYKADFAVRDGKIAAIFNGDNAVEAQQVVDAGNRHVLPGVIDTHVHIGWPDWVWAEDCVPTTKAAAAGGVTTLLCMTGQPRSIFADMKEDGLRFESNAYIDGAFHEAIYTTEQIAEITVAAAKGVATSFKFYMPYRGSEVVPPQVGIDDGIIYFGMKEIGRLAHPGLALVHAENIEIFFKLKDKFLAEKVTPYWSEARPNICEVESIRKVVAYAKDTGCALYIVHMSTREARREILRARDEGVTIYGETCPQYLALTYDSYDKILSKINPPLRTEEDVNSLWQAVADGTISCLGSDHAACSIKHKQDLWNAIPGFAGVQTLLPLLLSEGVNKGRITLQQAVALTSYNPARIFNMYPKKGAIAVGSDADFTIVDMNKERIVKAGELYHISDFTPFEGWNLKGWPPMYAASVLWLMTRLWVKRVLAVSYPAGPL